jgi:anti-anti-sigma factor
MNAGAPLTIAVEDAGPADSGYVRVGPVGEIDLANAEELASALSSPRCSECSGLLLDLRQVPFMDSSGLRVVLVASKELDGRFATLVEERSPVARLIEMVSLGDRLNLVRDEASAFAGFEAASSGTF